MKSEEEIEQLAEQALRKIEESTSLCANSSEEYIFIVGYVSGFKGQFRPSTQGGEEEKVTFITPEASYWRSVTYELKEEIERLKSVLKKVNTAINNSNMKNTILHNEVKQALNPKD